MCKLTSQCRKKKLHSLTFINAYWMFETRQLCCGLCFCNVVVYYAYECSMQSVVHSWQRCIANGGDFSFSTEHFCSFQYFCYVHCIFSFSGNKQEALFLEQHLYIYWRYNQELHNFLNKIYESILKQRIILFLCYSTILDSRSIQKSHSLKYWDFKY